MQAPATEAKQANSGVSLAQPQSWPVELKDPSLWRSCSWINDEWVSGASTFGVQDPGTGKEIGQVVSHGAEETLAAITAAHEAFKSWSVMTGNQRGAILAKLSKLCTDNIDDLATILSLENGKNLAEAKGEVLMSIGQLDWMAAEAVRGYGDFIPSALPGVRNIVIKQGVGVCGIITPWNFPLSMIVRKVAAAWAAGATCVVKAPRETPFSCLAFAVLAKRAGLPPAVYNVITTSRSSVVGKVLCESPIVRKISFTGSTPVGKVLMAQTATTLSKCSFELGGNAPFIVFDDADVELAADGAALTKFRCSGQVCIAINRILVQSGIHDKFVDALAKRVKQFKVGYGLDADVTHGPLINKAAVDKTAEHVDDAIQRGAKLVVGGKRMEGNFFEPTIITGANRSMLCSDDETFGPLAAIYKFDKEEEALELSNDTEYGQRALDSIYLLTQANNTTGLAGYFYSRDIGRCWRVAETLETGMVGINGASVSQACAPFGGVKQSGYGREGSKYGMEEFQHVKLIAMNIA